MYKDNCWLLQAPRTEMNGCLDAKTLQYKIKKAYPYERAIQIFGHSTTQLDNIEKKKQNIKQ